MLRSVRNNADMNHILDDLTWRGLIAQSTDLDALRADIDAGPITMYVGFDPTAPSLHMGNLVQILTARRFQLAGHKVLALVGGATGLIGDPRMSGERVLNDESVVASWVERIREQVEPFFDFSGPAAATMVNNLDWTNGLTAIEFLRDVGKHFSVNRMLDREAVAARLNTVGISYTEFSYQLLQSYDFLQLYRRFGCTLQTGGSDQWGNIVAGVDLIRRVEGARVNALTTPLLVKADGTKFGKTESGTVWLDGSLTSPYAFYQYWLNTDDADISRLLRIFTFRAHEEIEALEQATIERPHERAGQRALAEDLVSLVHGADQLRQVQEASKALFGQGDIGQLDPSTLYAALSEAGAVTIARAEIVDGVLPSAAELFERAGLASSRSAARRSINEGGAYVNNVRLEAEDFAPAAADLIDGRFLVLRRGRKTISGVIVAE